MINDELISNIAHQWRQPLSQINATVGLIDKLLYDKKIQDPEIEAKLQEIECLTKYMSNTIDDFRGHFASGTVQEDIALADVISEAKETLQVSFDDANIMLTSDIKVTDSCKCYKNELTQVIIVLLNNAKDALLDRNTFEAKVEIVLAKEEDYFVIEISDNAGGITKSVMQKMFEPYYTTKHHSVGTGLGLFMARKIIQERHKGTLEVQNRNRGSCFTIKIKERQA